MTYSSAFWRFFSFSFLSFVFGVVVLFSLLLFFWGGGFYMSPPIFKFRLYYDYFLKFFTLTLADRLLLGPK